MTEDIDSGSVTVGVEFSHPIYLRIRHYLDDDLYHQRTMSETVFSLLKNDSGEKLRSRTWHGQFREMVRKCIVHNLSRAAG